ncbi:MAG: sugar ABC transporter substrate-binding protein [Verrucomicrobiae bacterium]|nr:sugar ABC transporter substrate-binding protein [Verrucomicrobiae bacterium]
MNIFLRCLLPLALLGAAFAGCGKPSEKSRDGKPRIALVMKSLANEFFQTMERGAREHQAAHANDYDLLANGIKDELDVSRQIDLVEQMIAQRVNAIVIAPADSKALVPVCKKAMDAGIVVINIDNKFDATVLADKKAAIPFVGPDNRKGAKLVGDYLATKLKPGDKVAIIEGVPTAFNGQQRKLGFDDAVKAAGLSLASSQPGNWETTKANQVASALIIEHPDLKAFLCANDSMALGAIAALKAAGKSDQVLVVGYDNISAVQQLIREGKMLATADQHADKLAVFGIEYALQVLRDKSTPADRETPVELITKDNLK